VFHCRYSDFSIFVETHKSEKNTFVVVLVVVVDVLFLPARDQIRNEEKFHTSNIQ